MTTDPARATTPKPKVQPNGLDTTVLPLGERSLRLILDYVLAVGDEAETTYLEVKSSLDLGSKTGVAKVAKFLLGAANRRPLEAERHFHGHSVLVIGAQKNAALGIHRGVEPHELEDRLRPYLGPQFPAFEFGRIVVDDTHEVLFIIAQPPRDGQPIFPCHKTFQSGDGRDSLEDGAVYVRGTSNTRPARAGEIQALVERSRSGSKPPIVLEVATVGSIGRVTGVDELMDQLFEFVEEEFNRPPEATQTTLVAIPMQLASGIFADPEPKSASERSEHLDSWRRERNTYMARGREHFLGVALPAAGIRVVSHDRFVAKPHLIVTFHNCTGFHFLEPEEADFEKLVEPIVSRQSRYTSGLEVSDYRITTRGYPVDWANQGEDFEVTLTPESFRPNVPWTSDLDDYVLVTRDPKASSVTATWVLTEDGNDKVAKGEFESTGAGLMDAAALFEAAFCSGS